MRSPRSSMKSSETCNRVALSLTTSRPESGCVRVIPGSHHEGQLAHFDDHNDALTMLSRGQKLAGTAPQAYRAQFGYEPERRLADRHFTLQPGEAYFINNYTILHARTAFDDGDAPEDARRHLLRLWLDAPIRPVHPYIRSRGILPVAGRTPTFDWSSITAVRH